MPAHAVRLIRHPSLLLRLLLVQPVHTSMSAPFPPFLPLSRRRYAAIAPGGHGGRCFSRPLPLEQQGLLDGDLLRQYLLLPRAQQEGAAEAAGLERQQLLELLQGLWRAGGTLL